MPRKSKRYSEAQFKRDLTQLNKLIGSFKTQRGGKKTATVSHTHTHKHKHHYNRNSHKKRHAEEDFSLMYGGAAQHSAAKTHSHVHTHKHKHSHGHGHGAHPAKKKSTDEDFSLMWGGEHKATHKAVHKKKTAHKHASVADVDEDFSLMWGGAEDVDVRTFKVVELNGAKVNHEGRYRISNLYTRGKNRGQRRKNPPTPADAAKKFVTKHCRGRNKASCKVTFTLQETTRGSSHRLYGPYSGQLKRLSAKERTKMKNRKGKTFSFEFRPEVKLARNK